MRTCLSWSSYSLRCCITSNVRALPFEPFSITGFSPLKSSLRFFPSSITAHLVLSSKGNLSNQRVVSLNVKNHAAIRKQLIICAQSVSSTNIQKHMRGLLTRSHLHSRCHLPVILQAGSHTKDRSCHSKFNSP